MAGQKDGFRKLNDALSSTLKLTQQRGEELMKELLRAGEVQREQIRDLIDELSKKSKSNVEAVRDVVQREVSRQLGEHALPTREELQHLIEAVVEAALRKSGGSQESTHPQEGSAASDPGTEGSSEGGADSATTKPPVEPDAGSSRTLDDEVKTETLPGEGQVDADLSAPSPTGTKPRSSRAKSSPSSSSATKSTNSTPRKRTTKTEVASEKKTDSQEAQQPTQGQSESGE